MTDPISSAVESPLIATARFIWKRFDSMAFAAFGLFLMFAWAINPVPRRDQLTIVEGPLSAYTFERDQTPLSKHHVFLLFKIAGYDGRFWNDAVHGGNVAEVFPHAGVVVKVYAPAKNSFKAINGDGRKTYGLEVDGAEISSVEDALQTDTVIVRYVLPVLGLLLLALARYAWKRKDRQASPG